MKERLIGLFESHFGHRPELILDMAADGSTRHYFRLVGGNDRTAVGAIGPDREENRAFLEFARAFRRAGLPVPEIFAEDREAGVWIEEDLGDTTLFQALSTARVEADDAAFPADVEELYRRVAELAWKDDPHMPHQLTRFELPLSKVEEILRGTATLAGAVAPRTSIWFSTPFLKLMFASSRPL